MKIAIILPSGYDTNFELLDDLVDDSFVGQAQSSLADIIMVRWIRTKVVGMMCPDAGLLRQCAQFLVPTR